MKLGICTIQRDRGRWLTEWFAFHHLVGFRSFYFFAHRCHDNTYAVLRRLQRAIDITVYVVPDTVLRPQLAAYEFSYQRHGSDVDWMAFIDADEFLFPTDASDIAEPIARLDNGRLDALAAYWSCFGSSGRIHEPEGLIVENYRQRAPDDFVANRHIKSIVRGGLGPRFRVGINSHLFATPRGTFDERHRFIDLGLAGNAPSYEQLRVNHYLCQSLDYFRSFKQRSGAADHDLNYVRPDSWWTEHDRNDVYDSSVERFYADLRLLVRDWSAGELPTDADFPLATAIAGLGLTAVGRNEPCPCGSGRRFKHCHGAAPMSASHRAGGPQ